MSAMSHQPMDGRRSSAVSQVMFTPGGLPPGRLMSPNLLGRAHDLHHLGDRVHADDMRTAETRGGDGGGGAPVARGRVGLSARAAEKRLARRPDEQRPPERRRKLDQKST